ncbi:sphingosine N-acyltransferase lag1 [Mortierella alpina]|nr:sphingosine N-acyltransferase lag1 [Mortierella alpina]
MVLPDSRQPILSVSSPIANIALLHKESAGHQPSATASASPAAAAKNSSATCTTASESTLPSPAPSPAPTKASLITRSTEPATASFASQKRRDIHEKAKKNQRKLVEGKDNKSFLSFMYRHQLDIPAVFISTVLACHFGLRIPQVESFLILQNRDPMTGLYSKAWSDLNFIFFWIVAFTFLRAFVMTMILKPIAVRCGVKKEHQRTRFQEEGWVCLYYSLSWTLGMYVLRSSPVWNNWVFWFKPEAFFEGYPHTRLPHIMLWYYYVQLAFWLQQVFVLQVEVPRKDFWALMAHHTVTLLLIGGSALSNFWRAGNAVFVVMDLADIVLAFSKSIKYLGVASRICDGFFACFMVCWLYTRHFLYGYILHAFMFTAYEMIPFELDIAQGKWYCRELAWLPTFGLGLLQILMIYWFALILRIVVKILKGHSAEDDRSEDEEVPDEKQSR